MTLRGKDYLKNKKKKFLIGMLVWLVVMFSVFIIGYILNKSRNNIFTVVAAVLVLPAAQYATQLFAIWKFQDPDIDISNRLEGIRGDYSLFHSVLIPDQTSILYFDHIIVTGVKIYCIIDKPTDIIKKKEALNRKIKAKGISLKKIVYIEINGPKDLGSLLRKVEESIAIENESNLKEYTQLMAQMMM